MSRRRRSSQIGRNQALDRIHAPGDLCTGRAGVAQTTHLSSPSLRGGKLGRGLTPAHMEKGKAIESRTRSKRRRGTCRTAAHERALH